MAALSGLNVTMATMFFEGQKEFSPRLVLTGFTGAFTSLVYTFDGTRRALLVEEWAL